MAETVNISPAPAFYERALRRQGVDEGIVLTVGEDGGTRMTVEGDPLPIVARLVANIATLDMLAEVVMPSHGQAVEEMARRVAAISADLKGRRDGSAAMEDEFEALPEVVERLTRIANNLTRR